VLHTAVYGILVVGGVCLISLIGLELVQRLVPAVARQRHNDVAGFIYAALGVIYAVLLALVVITVWEEYQAASETVEQEAMRRPRSSCWATSCPNPRALTSRNSPDPTPRR
jgi:hypothetical protein